LCWISLFELLGYLKDPPSGNYGYIFQPPAKSQTYTFTSLAQVLSLDTLVPNLNDRIALAIALVETILQLHTSGWLHKGMRSENILFFKEGADMVKLREAFLEGYEYARANNQQTLRYDRVSSIATRSKFLPSSLPPEKGQGILPESVRPLCTRMCFD
jgi:hypothetical protein